MDGVALGRWHIDHCAGRAGNMVRSQSSGQRFCHGACIVIIILIEKRLRVRVRERARVRKYGGN